MSNGVFHATEANCRHVGNTKMSVVRQGLSVQAQNQSDMPTIAMPKEASSTSDVRGAREESEQGARKRQDSFPVGLCVTRKVNESITIRTTDGEIVVGLCELRGSVARIVVQAPQTVVILRTELLSRGDAS